MKIGLRITAALVTSLLSCVTDAPTLPPHLDPASDQGAESPQPLGRSLAGEVPREAQPLEERKAEAPPAGHDHSGHGTGGQAAMYTCPMHPEIRQAEPGECPKCGMRLVPEAPAVPDAGPPPAKKTPAPAKPPAKPAQAVYTCPMHPEVRQAQPGRCPKCGMKLEPAADPHGGH